MEKKVNKGLIALISTASVAFFTFLALMILVLCDYNFQIDKFNLFIANHRNSFWTGFFKVFTHLGSFYTLAVLTMVSTILIWFVMKNKRLSVFYVASFSVACVVSFVVKRIVRRIRPEHLMIIKQGGFSFPSGHSIMIFAFFALAIHFVWKYVKNRPLKIMLISLFSVIIMMIGFSRIYLGVHYLSDVLAGYLIAYVIFASFLMIYNSKCFKFLKDNA